MKTFVRCTVAILFVLGLSIQVNAQSNSTEKDGRFKVLTLEQVNALTADQIKYLTENDIAVKVKDSGSILSSDQLESIADRKQAEESADFSSNVASDEGIVAPIEKFQSSGNEAQDIARKQAILDTRNDQFKNAPDMADRAAGAQLNEKIKLTREELQNMPADVQSDYQQNPENYLIIDSNK